MQSIWDLKLTAGLKTGRRSQTDHRSQTDCRSQTDGSYTTITTICLPVQPHHYHYYMSLSAATPLSLLHVSQRSYTTITTICLSVQLHHYHYYMSLIAATPLSLLYVSQCSYTTITTICLSVQLHHYHYYMSPSAATPLSLLYVSQCSYTTITTITIYLQGIDRASFSFIKYVQISNLFQIFQHVPPTHMILLNLSSYIQSYSYYQTQGWMLQRDWNIVTFYLNANKIERI